MKWLLLLIGAIVAIVAVVALIGSTLPTEHVASRTVPFQHPPEKIWDVITDFETAPSWRKDLTNVERLPDRNGNPVWKETGGFGEMTYEITAFEPPNKLVMTIADEDLPFGGSWTYEIAGIDSASCRLTITENGEIYNPIYRFMARFLFGYHATIENYLTALAEKFGGKVSFGE